VTDEKTVDWLVQEIRDLLDVSNVGLYEFMEFLNDPDSPLSADEKESIATRALGRILEQDSVEMHRTRWASSENLGAVSAAELPSDPWRRPDENGDYIALDRTDN
jgi:hypothetical protein